MPAVCDFVDRLHGGGERTLEKPTPEAQEVCDTIERLITEQRAGLAVRPETLDPLTLELMLVWVKRERKHELLFRSDLAELVDALRRPRNG